ncbi:MAG TPA: DedA family protein [Rhodanobacter sp.]|nr:DedA family protein [Rhodanobacter sp.]
MELLDRLITIFAENGYAAVWIALLICGLGLPLPEDVTLVAGGVISGLGYANVHTMFLMCMAGVLLGDTTIFVVGRRYGTAILKWRWVARIVTPLRYRIVQRKFTRYGNRVLFVARFLPGLRTTIYLTAGVTRKVSLLRFILIDTVAAAISVPIWVYLGYFGANNHEWLAKWLQRGQNSLWVIVAIAIAGIGWAWWRSYRKRRLSRDD